MICIFVFRLIDDVLFFLFIFEFRWTLAKVKSKLFSFFFRDLAIFSLFSIGPLSLILISISILIILPFITSVFYLILTIFPVYISWLLFHFLHLIINLSLIVSVPFKNILILLKINFHLFCQRKRFICNTVYIIITFRCLILFIPWLFHFLIVIIEKAIAGKGIISVRHVKKIPNFRVFVPNLIHEKVPYIKSTILRKFAHDL